MRGYRACRIRIAQARIHERTSHRRAVRTGGRGRGRIPSAAPVAGLHHQRAAQTADEGASLANATRGKLTAGITGIETGAGVRADATLPHVPQEQPSSDTPHSRPSQAMSVGASTALHIPVSGSQDRIWQALAFPSQVTTESRVKFTGVRRIIRIAAEDTVAEVSVIQAGTIIIILTAAGIFTTATDTLRTDFSDGTWVIVITGGHYSDIGTAIGSQTDVLCTRAVIITIAVECTRCLSWA